MFNVGLMLVLTHETLPGSTRERQTERKRNLCVEDVAAVTSAVGGGVERGG